MPDDVILGELDAAGRPIHDGPGRHLMLLCDWSPAAQRAIRETVTKHGRPDEITHSRLIWTTPKAPWTEILIHRDAVTIDDVRFPYTCAAHLEGVVKAEIKGKVLLNVYDLGWGVVVDRFRGRISVFSDREGVNLLIVDIVGKVAREGLTVADAQLMFKKGVLQVLEGSV
jgi:hypothetical protein